MSTFDVINKWNKIANVRNEKKIGYVNSEGEFWPFQLSALTKNLNNWTLEQRRLILLQSSYRFLQESIQIESEMVLEPLSQFINGRTSIQFSSEEIAELIQVLVDESYHSLTAFELLNNIQRETNITPLTRVLETNRSYALDQVEPLVPQHLKDIFLLGVVCIAENTITNDLLIITNHKNVNENIHNYMVDHIRDEVRHSKVFEKIFKEKVKLMANEGDKELLYTFLKKFTEKMLDGSIAKNADKNILKWLNIENSEEILAKAYPERGPNYLFENDPIGILVANLLKRIFKE